MTLPWIKVRGCNWGCKLHNILKQQRQEGSELTKPRPLWCYLSQYLLVPILNHNIYRQRYFSVGGVYIANSILLLYREAEVHRSPTVAGIPACPLPGGAELCWTAACCGGNHCWGNESSCGETHRLPLFSWDITQQGCKIFLFLMQCWCNT